MQPSPRLGQAYHLVAEDEQQRLVSAMSHNVAIESAAFQVQTGIKDILDKHGLKERPQCTHCKKLGHTEEKCYEIVGYPSDWRKNPRGRKDRSSSWSDRRPGSRAAHVTTSESPIPGLTSDQFACLMKYINKDGDDAHNSEPHANMAGIFNFHNTWILDTGATDHITYDPKMLAHVVKAVNQLPVKVPTGQSAHVEGIGTAVLTEDLHLKKDLYIPDFHCNLLSISKLLTQYHNYCVILVGKICLIQDFISRKTIGVAEA